MQEENLDTTPCRVRECPALAFKGSIFRYCSIHNKTATDPDMFDLAVKGKLTPALKQFALDVERGIYPKRVW